MLASAVASGRGRQGLRLDIVLLFGLLALAVTVLQAVPLPGAVVGLLSPEAHQIQQDALGPLSAARSGPMTLSLSPGASWIEAARIALLLLVYAVARDVASRASRPLVAVCVAGAAVLVAVVGLAHALVGADAIYGVYRPAGVQQVIGPFVNGNHQAGLLAIGAAMAVGLSFSARDPRHRLLWVIATALMGVAGVFTRSRGGILAIVVAGVGALVACAGRDRLPRFLPAAILAVLLAGAVALSDVVVEVFSDTDTRKVEIWKPAPEYLGDFWLTGAGRGAFPVAYKRYQRLADERTFTHAENVPLQVLLDYGAVFGGLCVLGAAGGLLWLLARRHASSHEAAAAAGLGALALHNLVDFNLEIPGVAVPVAALLGALSARDGPRPWKWRLPRVAFLGIAGATATAALVLGLCASGERDEARVRAAARTGSDAEFRATLVGALHRQPADHLLPLFAAQREARKVAEGEAAGPLPWVNRALTLFPGSYDAHLMAARFLARSGRPGQAVLEYRLAIDARPARTEPLLHEMAGRWPRFEQLRDVARDRDAKLLRFDLLAIVLDRAGTRDQADRADQALLGVDPRHRRALSRRAWRALDHGTPAEARARAAALLAVDPGQAGCVAGTALLRQGRAAEAAAEFRRAASADPGERRAWLGLARASLAMGSAPVMDSALDRVRMIALGQPWAAEVEHEVGAIFEQAGRLAEALEAFDAATALDPSRVGAWQGVLRVAERLGRAQSAARARAALREGEGLGPSGPR